MYLGFWTLDYKQIRSSTLYLFGPVPSRRLGLSLGVDLLACKSCNLNCVYCELGRTSRLTLDRKTFVKTADVLDELSAYFGKGGKCDHVTISGAGEPTLALNLGAVIDGIRAITDTKIALLTNGVLLYDPQVRAEAAKADVVMPNVDAISEIAFRKVNRPSNKEDINRVLEGIRQFSAEFTGELCFEVMIVAGINDSDEEVMRISEFISSLPKVDRIQVNTVVRSRAEEYANPVNETRLEEIKNLLGPKAEVIGRYTGGKIETTDTLRNAVLSAVRLRPMGIEDLAQVINAGANEIGEMVAKLYKEGELKEQVFEGKKFYLGKK